MEEYKKRMVIEYKELKERTDKLEIMLNRWCNGTLNFTPTCPKWLLEKQLDVMKDYVGILETRAEIEDVELEALIRAAMGNGGKDMKIEDFHGLFTDDLPVTVIGDAGTARDYWTVRGYWYTDRILALMGRKVVAMEFDKNRGFKFLVEPEEKEQEGE